MAKATTGETDVDNLGLPGIVDEESRLAAIAKVRLAFDKLSHDVSSAEVSAKRIRLLELWRALVNMRQYDALPPERESANEGPINSPAMTPVLLSMEKDAIEIEGSAHHDGPTPMEDPDTSTIEQNSVATPTSAQPTESVIRHDIHRIRLRLIRPGILHDMVLPTGTVVLVHTSDAHDILERGIAEILLGDDVEVLHHTSSPPHNSN